MKRQIFFALILTAVASAGVLTGCTQAAAQDKAIQPQVWADKILTKVKFSDQLTEVGTEAALRQYSANMADISSFAVYAGTGATAEGFSVWRMRNKKAAETLAKNARALIAVQKDRYENYRPAEVPKLESAVIEQKGDGVVICVSADNAAAKRLIDGLFRKV